MVTVKMNGHKQILAWHFRDVVDPDDVDMLQDLIIAAINDAQGKVDEKAKENLGLWPVNFRAISIWRNLRMHGFSRPWNS